MTNEAPSKMTFLFRMRPRPNTPDLICGMTMKKYHSSIKPLIRHISCLEVRKTTHWWCKAWETKRNSCAFWFRDVQTQKPKNHSQMRSVVGGSKERWHFRHLSLISGKKRFYVAEKSLKLSVDWSLQPKCKKPTEKRKTIVSLSSSITDLLERDF